MKKITVTIGIPAYYSEENISSLLQSLLKQQERNIKIEKILVYSDGSGDRTAEKARQIKSRKIKVIASRKNKGFVYALQYLIRKNKSEVFVELNDDIRVDSGTLIEELVKPFRVNKRMGLVGGNIKALTPQSFIGKCIYTSYLAFLPLRYWLKNGETHLTCDGKIMALSRDFAKTLLLTSTPVGNADIYIYYENLRQRRLYKFAKQAEVSYRLPETVEDFKNQEARARASNEIVNAKYGDIIESNNNSFKAGYVFSVIKVFFKYPLESLFFKFFINRSSVISNKSLLKWRLALTTKKLSLIAINLEELKSLL